MKARLVAAIAVAVSAACSHGTEPIDKVPEGPAGRIAFARSFGGGYLNDSDSVHLYVLDLAASAVKRITSGQVRDAEPSWSPDGTRIAFSRFNLSQNESRAIYVVNADGSQLSRLGPGESPTWSPDGKKIAFIGACPSCPNTGVGSGIYSISADGTGMTTIAAPPPIVDLRSYGGITWSPDGSTIALHAFVERKPNQVFLLNADGTQPRLLTNNCTYLCQGISAEGSPSWSPDGNRIVFWSFGFGVTVINRDGTSPLSVTRDGLLGDNSQQTAFNAHPDWSPDAKWVVYLKKDQLFLSDVSGSRTPMALPSTTSAFDPAWSRR